MLQDSSTTESDFGLTGKVALIKNNDIITQKENLIEVVNIQIKFGNHYPVQVEISRTKPNNY